MSTSSAPLPVIVCGKHPVIAAAAVASLKPEYEAIRVILSVAAGVSEIPTLLRGEKFPTSTSTTSSEEEKENNLGSANYSKPPIAIIAGGGYDDSQLSELRKACEGSGVAKVPWLRPDMSKATPPLGPAYGEALVVRIKVLLEELRAEGKMGEDGVYFF